VLTPWARLPRDEIDELLAEAGTSAREIVCDARDDLVWGPVVDRAPKLGEARLRLALKCFGDHGRPQPTERTNWSIHGRTRKWLVARLDEVRSPAAAAEPVENGPPRVGKPGRRAKPIAGELEAAIIEHRIDADPPTRTQEEIGDELGFTRNQVKHFEGRIRRRLKLARERSG
jgi:hypothetical protein